MTPFSTCLYVCIYIYIYNIYIYIYIQNNCIAASTATLIADNLKEDQNFLITPTFAE